MATAATVPSRTPATEQATKPGGTRSPALSRSTCFPLCPQTRTLLDAVGMSQRCQTEKNSVRAYVFRFALKLGHCSMYSAFRFRAKGGSDPDSRRRETAIVRHIENGSVKPLPCLRGVAAAPAPPHFDCGG